MMTELFAELEIDDGERAAQVASLYDAWEADVSGGDANRTVALIEKIISASHQTGTMLLQWGKAIILLKDAGLAGADLARQNQILRLYGVVHGVLTDLSRQAEIQHNCEYDSVRWLWWCISYGLSKFYTLDDAFDKLREFLPEMGVKSGPSLSSMKRIPNGDTLKYAGGDLNGQPLLLADEECRFSTNLLAPAAFWHNSPADRQFFAMPLHSDNELYGYLVCEMRLNLVETEIYDFLMEELSQLLTRSNMRAATPTTEFFVGATV